MVLNFGKLVYKWKEKFVLDHILNTFHTFFYFVQTGKLRAEKGCAGEGSEVVTELP